MTETQATYSDARRGMLADQWQIPLLAVGVLVFSSGVYRMAEGHRVLTFDQRIDAVRTLRATGAHARASAYVLDLLRDRETTHDQKAELHRQLAATIFAAEAPLRRHDVRNVESVIDHYRRAIGGGTELDGRDWVQLGDAYGWAARTADAVGAYERALASSLKRPDRVRTKLLRIQLRDGAAPTPDTLEQVDLLLADAGAAPDDYVWALEIKIGDLLGRGDMGAAMGLLTTARSRLAATEALLPVDYLEARCLIEAGMLTEAAAVLSELRERWTVQDDLWARSGWLLGQIQQSDDRPLAAMTYYDEVVRSFPAGPIFNLCRVGRAQCLAALGMTDRSLDEYEELIRQLRDKPAAGGVDRQVIRTDLGLMAESLRHAGQWRAALRAMQIVYCLIDNDESALGARTLSDMASVMTRLANDLLNDDAAGPEAIARSKAINAEAADTHLKLADLAVLDDQSASSALEAAADAYEAAGDIRRVIQTLRRLVTEHQEPVVRAHGLFRLGQAHQSQREFEDAIACYDEILDRYPRVPDAVASMVPLANCLLRVGDEEAARGERLLIDIVEDRGPDPLFTPQAQEYRDALIRLGEYYYGASENQIVDHLERAISRIEDVIVLYPDDPGHARHLFLLADSYRRSADRLADGAAGLVSPLARDQALAESRVRWRRGAERFDQVVRRLASRDAAELDALEQAQLRAAYLYRGDCLFDLREYDAALSAYHEVAWRYENEAEAVTASVQIIHCQQRLGRMSDARATLARMRWILEKIPSAAFDASRGMSTKAYWTQWVDRLERTGVY
jgi:tetratricopeptide (TPR) repeat protein